MGAHDMDFRSGTSITYTEVQASVSVSLEAIAHRSGDTKLAVMHGPSARLISKDFCFIDASCSPCLWRGRCSSSALQIRATPLTLCDQLHLPSCRE